MANPENLATSLLPHVNHNPDVLSCLANLSNDEVFTPPNVANAMLDMLPQELFKNPDTKFLDPVCKSGVFLREITKRLMTELAEEIPNLQDRLDHILHNQVYGIAITELTSLLSRRTLYCTKYPNCDYSISRFDNITGNIRYKAVKHTWRNGKCIFCGASRAQYERETGLESYAYEFIHMDNLQEIFRDMKFDVIIGNPPYQLNVGVEKENYAIPVYHKFIENAKKLNPKYLSMIIPARWYAGGRGLADFRNRMLNDCRLSILHDFPDASDIFSGVQIKAGVCYFLWDSEHSGECYVTNHFRNIQVGPYKRKLLEPGMSTFIRFNKAISILRKTRINNDNFSKIVSSQTPFGLITSFKGSRTKTSENDLKMYLSGNDKEFKGKTNYVSVNMISRGKEMIKWHKIYIPKVGSGSDSFPHQIIGIPFYGKPDTVCNQSYLVIGPFKDIVEANNAITYMKTKFFRFLVLQKKNSQDAMRGVYELVPLQEFSKSWTDAELYAKYNLTQEEIDFIESMIKPMDLPVDANTEINDA